MPRLPDVTALGQRPVANARTPIVSDQSGDILAGGFAQLGAGIDHAMDRIDQFATASARSSILTADVTARSSLDGDPDYQTYEQRYQESMQKAMGEASKRIPDAPSRALFEQQAGLDIQRGLAEVRAEARRKEVDSSRAGLDETITNNRTSALQAPDEATRSAFISATVDAIAGAQRKGYLSAQEATNLRQSWTTNYAEGYVSMQPVDTQIKMLAAPKGTLAEYIDPAKRVEMIDTAQRRRIAEEDHAWSLSQRAEKLMHDAASKDLDHALANHELSPTWIEANRARLSPDDYRYAYKALESDSATDINLYADLRERASGGQDVRDDARKALTDRRISRGDYDRLVSEVESERPGWYKRGAGFIQNALKPSDINPDPAAPQRFANALDDWGRWASENPKATEAQASDAYRRITSEYALIKLDMITLSGRMPRFLVGDRQAPNFDATEDATVRALKEGRIDRAEFERQASLIKQWRDAHQATQALQKK